MHNEEHEEHCNYCSPVYYYFSLFFFFQLIIEFNYSGSVFFNMFSSFPGKLIMYTNLLLSSFCIPISVGIIDSLRSQLFFFHV